MADKVKHTITIDPTLLKEIKFIAVKDDKRYGEVVEEALKEYLAKHRKK